MTLRDATALLGLLAVAAELGDSPPSLRGAAGKAHLGGNESGMTNASLQN
eukprot:CAMPEP_0197619864 /NCGR_PEP_ID=MMETSP1338-20131121/840_1 /TAXON_ID=43686 ORGANISM="Pelagodinium beii, Strain RCC1491" /NCGR_SAMPLE_ID=MMETSP1338 /ASSEMBLY_ACC=CAM_ASM_000754 /LENGTH=49 /DNA_ID= /DNA_START= /DNA_END= /DNA_ORIENTATION=